MFVTYIVSIRNLNTVSAHAHTRVADEKYILHTDGSTLLNNGWPAIPVHAGWGAFFAIMPTRHI